MNPRLCVTRLVFDLLQIMRASAGPGKLKLLGHTVCLKAFQVIVRCSRSRVMRLVKWLDAGVWEIRNHKALKLPVWRGSAAELLGLNEKAAKSCPRSLVVVLFLGMPHGRSSGFVCARPR